MNQKDSENEVQYKKSNGCSKKPSLAMILTLLIMFVIIALHALIIRSIVEIGDSILSVLLAFNYVMLVVVSIDYFILLIVDPVDPRLLTNSYKQNEKDKRLLVYCTACRKDVHVYSYHCKVCKRCADEFDHHCIFLNNCIGRKNYANFFRVLLTLSMFLMINIGEGIWVAILKQGSQRWLGVSLAIFAGLVVPQVLGLMGFHCYISLCLYKTTLQYIRGELDAEQKDQLAEMSPGGVKMKKNEVKPETETSINRNENI